MILYYILICVIFFKLHWRDMVFCKILNTNLKHNQQLFKNWKLNHILIGYLVFSIYFKIIIVIVI